MKFNSFSGWTPWLFSILVIIVAVQSCQPEDPDPEIDIETGEIEEIGPTQCVIYGEIYETGINGILQHGFVWSLLPDVTLDSGDKNELGTAGPGSYSSTIRDLSPNTTYYIRAYAADANQTKYGSEKVFETSAPTVPVLNTWSAYNVGPYSAGSGGDIYSHGGDEVTARGICWSTGRNPTINDHFTNDGKGRGGFESLMSPLEPYTVYNMRAYATNSEGTGYGQEILFVTLWDNATISDFDGNAYATVQIGDLVWMAENLKSLHYSDGSSITRVEADEDWMALEPDIKAYSFFDNSTEMYDTFGAFYTWAAAMNGEESSGEVPSGIQGVCPSGWHLPSEDEWKELEYPLGMTELKAKDEGWRGEILHEPYEEKSGFSVRCVMDR